MKKEIRYIELKTGYSNDGPAWIGEVKMSKSGKTIYFNNKAFRRQYGQLGEYYDVETNERYWISNVKKDGTDRHWAGRGKVVIERDVVADYLEITGQKAIDYSRLEIHDIPKEFPTDRIKELENSVKEPEVSEPRRVIGRHGRVL